MGLLFLFVGWIQEVYQRLIFQVVLASLFHPVHLLAKAFLAEMVTTSEHVALEAVMVAPSTDKADLVPDLSQRWLAHLRQIQIDRRNTLVIDFWFLFLLLLLLLLRLA